VCEESGVPFGKFRASIRRWAGDALDGRSDGRGDNFGEAFDKAQRSAGVPLPKSGRVFFSVNDRHKREAVEIARRLAEMGFELAATRGTASVLKSAG